ncbi:cutinase family protein [Oryzobacter terrae]|uniref:cutinase family protein n=1 Tax=Oryzobacter terrae TaxID=1620385 RepID=UPI0036733BA9
MSRRTTAARIAATTALLAATVGTQAAVTPATATSSTATCASIIQIVARGSNEAAGTRSGNVYTTGGRGIMSSFASAVSAGTTKSVRTVGLAYPAEIAPGTSWGYVDSQNIGRDRLAAELKRLTGLCPSSKFVLIGYSQGAHVIGDVLSNSNPEGISSTTRSRVAAVFLTGDPVRRYGESFNRGTGTGGGALANRGAGQLSGLGSRIISYCYKGDFFCDYAHRYAYNDAIRVHESYNNTSLRTYAKNWILTKI